MYSKILITLDVTPADRTILDHMKLLARLMHSRVALLHVADGWAVRWSSPAAISRKVEAYRAYLEEVRAEFMSEGIETEAELVYGDRVTEIVRWVREKGSDLVAMSTHGHRFLADLFLGITAIRVQHHIAVPVLMLRAR
ncbi:MAG: universal stress protein [Thermoanaerobaculaceae bacterium]